MSVQAKVFSMVNQNQTKVNKSLVYDLESLSKSRSPWRTCHLIAVYLNSTESSPFHHRIKRLGVKSQKNEIEPLTQAAFVDNLVKLISPVPQEDRNYILGKDRGLFSFYSKKPSHFEKSDLIKFPFRKVFFADEDEVILKVVFDFFTAVESVWPNSWNKKNSDSVLNKTVGLIALIRLLGAILSAWLEKNNDLQKIGEPTFTDILKRANIEENYFSDLDATSKTGVKVFHELNQRIGMPFD
jgi:DGQHR domain-containing protein